MIIDDNDKRDLLINAVNEEIRKMRREKENERQKVGEEKTFV
jgi:hypothetical protein